MSKTCSLCDGKGAIDYAVIGKRICKHCNGTGTQPSTQPVTDNQKPPKKEVSGSCSNANNSQPHYTTRTRSENAHDPHYCISYLGSFSRDNLYDLIGRLFPDQKVQAMALANILVKWHLDDAEHLHPGQPSVCRCPTSTGGRTGGKVMHLPTCPLTRSQQGADK